MYSKSVFSTISKINSKIFKDRYKQAECKFYMMVLDKVFNKLLSYSKLKYLVIVIINNKNL